jgi:hypothetical protein
VRLVPLRGPDQTGVGIQDADGFADPREVAQDPRIVERRWSRGGFDQAKSGGTVGFFHAESLEHTKNIGKPRAAAGPKIAIFLNTGDGFGPLAA